MNNTTIVTDAISSLHIEGNVTPMSWYHNIKTAKGKPDHVAIMILSDIVYWYRNSEVRDEQTGQVIGFKKKFRADALQRGYGEIAKMFGISKEQARDACHRLRNAGIIEIDIRHNINCGQGVIANNVVYLIPNPDKISEITYRLPNPTTQVAPTEQATPPSEVHTNTNTSTNISFIKDVEFSDENNNTFQPAEELELNKMPIISSVEEENNKEFDQLISANDHRHSVAATDPVAETKAYVKEVALVLERALSPTSRKPTSVTISAARQAHDKLKLKKEDIIDYCAYHPDKYLQLSQSGRSPNAYWIVRDCEEWLARKENSTFVYEVML